MSFMNIVESNFTEAYDRVLSALILSPRVESRIGPARESCFARITLLDPTLNWLAVPLRRVSPQYAVAELLWYLARSDNGRLLLPYASQYASNLDSDGIAAGAYGKRWSFRGDSQSANFDQLAAAYRLLLRDPGSRQAVVSHWDRQELRRTEHLGAKDFPCTLSLQFILRSGKLSLAVTMRSNDAWIGLPYDLFAFTTIQRLMAAALGAEVGTYHHFVGSLHLYEKHYETAVRNLDKAWDSSSVYGNPMIFDQESARQAILGNYAEKYSEVLTDPIRSSSLMAAAWEETMLRALIGKHQGALPCLT